MGFIHVLYFCVCTLYQCECICFMLADHCRKTSVISDTFECNSSYVIIVALCTLPWGIDTLAIINITMLRSCRIIQFSARWCKSMQPKSLPACPLLLKCGESTYVHVHTVCVHEICSLSNMVLAPYRGEFLRVQFLLTGYLYHFRRFNFQRMHTLAPIIHYKFILPI